MATKLHFVFLNQTFSDRDGNIKLFQIVENTEDEYVTRTKVVTLEELTELYNKGQSDKSLKFDFKIINGYLKSENVRNSKLSDSELAKIKGASSVHAPHITTIYDLFTKIVECGGNYIDETEYDNLGKEEWLDGVTTFIPNYSRSTMTVSLAVKTTESWKTRKIIYVEEGKLVTSDFMFCVKEEYKKHFEEFDIEYIGDYQISGFNRAVYKYTGDISIYSFTSGALQIYPSILNRYTFMSELYDAVIKSADFICKTLSESLNNYDDNDEAKQVDKSKYVSKYTNSYVTFELAKKRITNAQRNFYIKDILTTIEPKVRNKEMAMIDVIKHTKTLKLDYMETLVYLVIFDILVNSGQNIMDRIERCMQISKNYKIRKFKADTFLYIFRSCLYYTNGKLGPFTRLVLSGSDIPYETILKRRTVND